MRMIPLRLFKRFILAGMLVFMTGAQSACALLKPFGFFSKSEQVPVHEVASFRYEIPRPVSASLPEAPSKQASKPATTKAHPVISSKFEFKSFIDKIIFYKPKRDSVLEQQLPQLASVKLPEQSDSQPTGSRSAEQIEFCNKIDKRLSSISLHECMAIPFYRTGYLSENGQPIMLSRFARMDEVEPTGRILLLGGVHGDELSSVSIVFEWMQFLKLHNDGKFVWDVVPVMNPDGLFQKNSTRTNANGVDLNRNMPTANWAAEALNYWRRKTGSAPRKFPGNHAGSELETQWLMHEIDQFRPDMIISVHAPHNLIDYDAPSRKYAPRQFGHLKGGLLGTFPGSLGNYAGVTRGIPVVTIELASADKAVPVKLAHDMWSDMLSWLSKTVPIENKRFMENRRYANLNKTK